MTTPKEQATFQPSETKLTRDVTPQEIAERTGGSTSFASDGYITAIKFGHTEGLQILTKRAHGQTRERLFSLKLPNGETHYLDNTSTTLRPDSVTFVIPIRSERPVSPNQTVEVTITRESFSYSMLSA